MRAIDKQMPHRQLEESSRDLRNHFARIAAWIKQGEPVEITIGREALCAIGARRAGEAATVQDAGHHGAIGPDVWHDVL